MQTWLCIVVLVLVALPGTTASIIKAATLSAGQQPVSVKARGSLISILRTTLATFEGAPSAAPSAAPAAAPSSAIEEELPVSLKGGVQVGNKVALQGGGGGLDVLEAKEEDKIDKSVFRPWKTRFQLQPFDFDSRKFQTAPENRLSYRHFYAANPRTAEAPGSRDRNAQSDVLMVFGFTALVAVISGVLIITKLEVLRADELSLVSYQSKMLQVIIYAAVPWLLLGTYLLTIFVSFVGNPMRYPGGAFHWQCGAMTWFIFVAPIINLLYFTSHAVWISRICFSVEQQAPMGRMFSLGIMPQDQPGNNSITRITNMLSHSAVRQMLFFLEVLCAISGYLLITFRWGANAQFCNPEVYWTATALCVTVSIVIVFTSLAFVCSIFIRAVSVSPWMEDFAESFWQADLNAKIARNEAKEDKLVAKAEAQAANEEYEAQFTEWNAWHEEFDEERKRHEAITKEHEEYQGSVKEAPPQRIRKDADVQQPTSDEATYATSSLLQESPEEPRPAHNMAGQTVANNHFGTGMPYGAQSMPPGTMTMPGQMFGSMPPGTLRPGPVAPSVHASMPYRVDHFLPPGSHPPGTLPPSILAPESMRPGTLPPSARPGTLPPSAYGFRGPMGSMPPAMRGPMGTMGSLAAAPSGSLPPGSFGFHGSPSTLPPSYLGTLSAGGPQFFAPGVRSGYTEGSSEADLAAKHGYLDD